MHHPPFDPAGRFILRDFGRARPFSSFLPGIAGVHGVPLWVFTVNRGQAIAAFGVASKDNPIMEFQPADRAYQQTALTGFRTFIKRTDTASPTVYEPFAPQAADATTMAIGMNDLQLTADNPDHGWRTEIRYFTLTDEPFAGLVRQLTLTNISDTPMAFELLDGMARVMPYGVDNHSLKRLSRTLEAWMAVYSLPDDVSFFRLQASAADSAEVDAIQAGHFYLAFDAADRTVPQIVDPTLVFANETSLIVPVGFAADSLADLAARTQTQSGRTPCAFAAAAGRLEPGEQYTLTTIVGHVGSTTLLDAHRPRLARMAYVAAQHAAAQRLTETITDRIATASGLPLFDAYARQTFLDNVLRGGLPLTLGERFVYHIYSRKHGDLERDYNDFYVAAEPYSQGNGNYRDVLQNRRCEVWFTPEVGDFNVRLFISLLQADGYNPLVVQGTHFTVPAASVDALAARAEPADAMAAHLRRPFTPGSLLRLINDHALTLDVSVDTFLATVLRQAEQHVAATHGEGFWSDHWTYNLDLIEAFLAIFPEQEAALLFTTHSVPFFRGHAFVQPRAHKYVLTERGVRQYGAVHELAPEAADSPWVVDARGVVYRTSVFVKLLCLAVVKFATRDAAGMGIEMEGGKPGWNDALNGLPGLLGSSVAESAELLRLLRFLDTAIERQGRHTVRVPTELYNFLHAVAAHLYNYHRSTHPRRDFYYWDAVAHARERYRESVRTGFDGREERIRLEEAAEIVQAFAAATADGIGRVAAFAVDEVPPTYFRFEVAEYAVRQDATDARGRPLVDVHALRPIPLPLYLEGPVRTMRLSDGDSARALHAAVLRSDLYDRKLKMFRVNASLAAESHEIGRARAFTPGWLENESIWLHMEYKYLLELLRAGLHTEFFAAFKDALIPFQSAERYGRSPLENASFLVSSAHPDDALHGAGFAPRLSGATAEFLSMWTFMMAGPQPFHLHADQLCLSLAPTLPEWLFDADGRLSFTFLGRCRVTYHNRSGRPTYGPAGVTPQAVILTAPDGTHHTFADNHIPHPFATQVREGAIAQLDITLA